MEFIHFLSLSLFLFLSLCILALPINFSGDFLFRQRAGNENDLDHFLNSGYIRNTVNLKLHKFGRDAVQTYPAKAFCELLANFGMIEHLLLWDVWLSDDVAYDTDDVVRWLPNLKGFGFTGGSNQRLSQCIIRYFVCKMKGR